MPDTGAVAAAMTGTGGQSSNPFAAAQSGNDDNNGNSGNGGTTRGAGTFGSLTGAGTAGNAGNEGATVGTGNNDDGSGNTRGVTGDGNEDSGNNIPLTSDPKYISAMGNGSDWTEVMNGNITRNSDEDIVVDENGKVILTSKYAEAIESVCGVKEGEKDFDDKIPEILEKVLCAPFAAKMIKDVKNGKKLDSSYDVTNLGARKQDYRGKGKNDNSDTATEKALKVIKFYWPIFEKASAQGWKRG
jgi:hypothetical protein